jgi:hypothetical protein
MSLSSRYFHVLEAVEDSTGYPKADTGGSLILRC